MTKPSLCTVEGCIFDVHDPSDSVIPNMFRPGNATVPSPDTHFYSQQTVFLPSNKFTQLSTIRRDTFSNGMVSVLSFDDSHTQVFKTETPLNNFSTHLYIITTTISRLHILRFNINFPICEECDEHNPHLHHSVVSKKLR